MSRANYQIIMSSKKCLVIKDVGPWHIYQSVTNAAEEVVQELVDQGKLPEGRKLLYLDTEGKLDQILIKKGKFSGFKEGGEMELQL